MPPARKSSPTSPPPALRADAARNRELVLDAAAAVFAEGGADASTEEIARRAGVGVGTVFRHFPTKELLLGAVLERMFHALAMVARRAPETSDVEVDFFVTLHRLVDGAAAKMAVADALSRAGVPLRYSSWAEPLREALADLLSRAHAARALRDDVGVAELMAVLIAASRAAQFAGKEKGLRKRVVSIVLDGLRRTPTPSGIDPWNEARERSGRRPGREPPADAVSSASALRDEACEVASLPVQSVRGANAS